VERTRDDADEHTSAVQGFYDRIVEYEWRRLDAYPMEHATVRHFLERHLPKPLARVIDVGSGPGRYAIALAQQGYDVMLVDLSPQNVAWAAERIAEAGVSDRARSVLGDARSLAAFSSGQSDAALLLGPLYHLPAERDRKQAIRELRRVLRDGGVAFTMMLTRAAAIFEGINRWPRARSRRKASIGCSRPAVASISSAIRTISKVSTMRTSRRRSRCMRRPDCGGRRSPAAKRC